MTNPIVNDTFSAKNIVSAAVVYTWTVPAGVTGTMHIQVFLDNAAGNGDYVFYLSKTINGAGSEYLALPKTTVTAASGETAFHCPTIPYDVVAGDVIKFYVDGLAGDTSVNGKVKIFVPTVNLAYILGTALTETVAGYLAAAFKKLFDVPSPVLTAASVDQTGDAYGIVNHGTYGNSALHTDIAGVPDAVHDEAVEGAYTLRQLIRVTVAALAAKLSGAGTTTITIRDVNDTKNRIVATVDSSGNRTAITLDASE